MKLLAVPLARARPGAQPIVTYVAFRSKDKQAAVASEAADAQKGSEASKRTVPLTTRLLNKASDFWIDLGKPGQKSTFDWKRRTYNAGEKLMDRIEYQEWSLKGIDPAMGPSLRHPTGNHEEEDEPSASSQGTVADKKKQAALGHIPLLYAASASSPKTSPHFTTSPSILLRSLRQLAQHRAPHHKQRLIYCLIGMPITLPFALVPVIPNLPFFYLCWRAFSHWKAFKASEYVSQLIQQGRIEPTASAELERILSTPAPAIPASTEAKEKEAPTTTISSSQQQSKDASAASAEPEDPRVILQAHHIEMLLEAFPLDRQSGVDLRRARDQTLSKLQQAANAPGGTSAAAAADRLIEEMEKAAAAAESEELEKKTQ